MYVYIQSEPDLWTAGFYKPDGRFEPESDHGTVEAAAKHVHYLNGGNDEKKLISKPSTVRGYAKGETMTKLDEAFATLEASRKDPWYGRWTDKEFQEQHPEVADQIGTIILDFVAKVRDVMSKLKH